MTAATRQEIEQWKVEGQAKGATHLIVVCDSFDWDDYPVYVEPGQDAEEVRRRYDGKAMQRVMEVIKL